MARIPSVVRDPGLQDVGGEIGFPGWDFRELSYISGYYNPSQHDLILVCLDPPELPGFYFPAESFFLKGRPVENNPDSFPGHDGPSWRIAGR